MANSANSESPGTDNFGGTPTQPADIRTDKQHEENSTKTVGEEKQHEEGPAGIRTLGSIMQRYKDIFPPDPKFTSGPYGADPNTVKSVQSWMRRYSPEYVVVALERARKANRRKPINFPGRYFTHKERGVFLDIESDLSFANYQFECIERGEPLPTRSQFTSDASAAVGLNGYAVDRSGAGMAKGTRRGYLSGQLRAGHDDHGQNDDEFPY